MSEETNNSSEVTAKQINALDESIAHWQRMHDDKRICNEGTTVLDCACCVAYYRGGQLLCSGCPISKFTGELLCGSTPYLKASDADDNLIDGSGTLAEFQVEAKKEIAFLRTVRDWCVDGKPARGEGDT